MKLEKPAFHSLFLFLFLLFLNGCGGGGSEDGASSTGDGDGGSTNGTTFTKINGPLKGRYFASTHLNNGKWFDLESGEHGIYFDETIDFDSLEGVTISPDGRELIEIHEKQQDTDSILDPVFTVVYFKDIQTGLVNDQFSQEGSVKRANYSQLSPDGEMVAIMHDPYDDNDETITFITRTGERVAKFKSKAFSIRAFDWLPDGKFVVGDKKAIYVGTVSKNDIKLKQIVSIAHIEGYPVSFKVSPDGKQLLFEMATKEPILFETNTYRYATLHRVDIDGSNLTLVAKSDQDIKESQVNNPLWSLDGKYIFTTPEALASVVIIWDPASDNPYTDNYDPDIVEDAFASSSPGVMNILPKDAREFLLTDESISYPIVAYNKKGKKTPYKVKAGEIDSSAMLVPFVKPLPEQIAPVPPLGGSIVYVRDWYYEGGFRDDEFVLLERNLQSGSDAEAFHIRGEDYHYIRQFDLSKDRSLVALWFDKDSDYQYLMIHEKNGKQLKKYNLSPKQSLGIKLIVPPLFSPQNSDFVLLLFKKKTTHDFALKSVIAVLDWTRGELVLKQTGDIKGAAWMPNGDIVASIGKDLMRFSATGVTFSTPQKLFDTPNIAKDLQVSSDGTKLLFTMSGHIFTSNLDGSDLVQHTAPSTEFERTVLFSPDDKSIVFHKWFRDFYLHFISSSSMYLRIYPEDSSKNQNKAISLRMEDKDGYTIKWLP